MLKYLSSIASALLLGFAGTATAERFGDEVGFGDEQFSATQAWQYRQFTQSRRGSLNQISPSLSWAMEIHIKTGLALPRIIDHPWPAEAARANTILDGIHGRLIDMALHRYGDLRRPSLPSQSAVEVGFFSLTILSVSERGSGPSGGSMTIVFAHGITIDIARGRTFGVTNCGTDDTISTFKLADIFEVCTSEKLERFLALWKARAEEQARRVPSGRLSDWLDQCRRIVPAYIDKTALFSLHLTKNGLGVHSLSFTPNSESSCADVRNPFNPVVIPYRDLESFMMPGPLRDELLTAVK